MTLVSQIVTDAYRESNLVAVGKSPSAAQVTEALRLYNRLIKFITGGEAGETLRDWPLGNFGRQSLDLLRLDTTQIDNPPINARLIHTAEIAKTVYLPAKPSDGSRMAISDPFGRLAAFNITLDANGRTIEQGATLALSTDDLQRTWFYRAELADWVRITDLVEADNTPFPEDFDDLQIIMLALRLMPRTGRKLTTETGMILKQQQTQFIARYSQSEDLTINPDLRRNARQAYSGLWDSSEAALYGYGS